eukprot:comp22535_c3_seq1/m.34225 comp22535_c3_seq1/g.34225  ORF comp22535_c3_seq1/g.34225 comp22535_c3_seq1/m.34225 type:complete len:309 (-) comp22535_c3_seq1:556-1482(-)
MAPASYIDDAVNAIYNAISGLGTNEDKLIEICCRVSYSERLQIRDAYQKKHGRDVASHIADDTSFDIKNLMVALMQSTADYLANEVHWAVAGPGTADQALIDCLSFENNFELEQAKASYKAKFGHDMTEDVSDDTSGGFRKCLLAILAANRDQSGEINEGVVATDAKNFYDKGEGRLGTDDDWYIEFLTRRSRPHVARVAEVYQAEHKGKTLQSSLDEEFNGTFEDVLYALCTPKTTYWLDRLYAGLKGMGTCDRRLIRAMRLLTLEERREIDNMYKEKYGKSLKEDIEADTSGYYKKALLALFDDHI